MFEYDVFQKQAIELINQGHSVIVSAPTGAGKTAVAEYVIEDCFRKGLEAIYTAPIKALSNQKFRDFSKLHPGLVGILTGDVSINPHAPLMIMTTEIFRNKLLEADPSLPKKKWIIFDEIHFLDDIDRGTVWEESLMMLPLHMNVLALSATIPNIDKIAEWMESIHPAGLRIVKEDKRPVPLSFYFQCQNRVLKNTKELKQLAYRTQVSYSEKIHPNRLRNLMEHLKSAKRLPCIYFSFSRRKCEDLAAHMHGFDFLNKDEKKRILSMYEELLDKYNLQGEYSAQKLRESIRHGIAYHHAGMLPSLKEVVERLFTSRLIQLIFTTETFALGINMPARSVVMDELKKPYGRFYSTLRTRDFYQMAGRAGRRGMDKEGFVYSRINPHAISSEEIERIIFGEHEPVKSQFNLSYATLLHLYEDLGENLHDLYLKSLHFFQSNKGRKRQAQESIKAKIALLKKMGYIKHGALTDKGKFAYQIYGYELPMAELYQRGILDKLSVKELLTLIGAIVYEPRKGERKPKLSKTAKHVKKITKKISKEIRIVERGNKIFPLSKRFFFHLAEPLGAYSEGASFSNLYRYTNTDEGELVRYFRMTIQILREIRDAKGVKGLLKEKASKAIESINRDVVDAEKQLRVS